jgi:hypothetical protein
MTKSFESFARTAQERTAKVNVKKRTSFTAAATAEEMSLANYNRTQAAIARFRLYPLTVLYTVFAILMVMIGFWAAHPWTTVAFFSAGCLIWTCIEYLVHRFVPGCIHV